MSNAPTNALLALWPPFTKVPSPLSTAAIRDFVHTHLQGKAPDMAELQRRGWVTGNDSSWRLTHEGIRRTRSLRRDFRASVYASSFLQTASSTAYQQYNHQVHGKHLLHQNMVFPAQLAGLIEVLSLGQGDRFADLGCATGDLTTYIANQTGAMGLGLDFAVGAVQLAQTRAKDRSDLEFVVGDLDDLKLEAHAFDAVLSIDTLYFAEDLQQTVQTALGALRPGGRFAAFFSQTRAANDAATEVAPGGRLGQVLHALDVPFHSRDYTDEAHNHWKRVRSVLDALRPAFEAEGTMALWTQRDVEVSQKLPAYDSGRARRWLIWHSI